MAPAPGACARALLGIGVLPKCDAAGNFALGMQEAKERDALGSDT